MTMSMRETHKVLDGITHYAKAGHWLAAAVLALVGAAAGAPFRGAWPPIWNC